MIGPKHKGAPPTAPFEEIMVKAQQALDANDLDLAERLFGQATVVKPASPTAWYGKGCAFSIQEAWDKALRCFAIATKFDPKFANAWAGLAACYLHLGEREKVRPALEKAKEFGADPPRLAEIEAALNAPPEK